MANEDSSLIEESKLKERSSCLKRLYWLCVLFPILSFLWAAIPADEFHIAAKLALTILVGNIFGLLARFVPHIPGFIGMILAGVLLRNFEIVQIESPLPSSLRLFALAVILLKGGINLNFTSLKRSNAVWMRLAFLPSFLEATTVTFIAHFFFGLPYLWSLLLGLALAAVSPAALIPALANLKNKQLGTMEEIPTLIMAASTFDDITVITGFGLVCSIVFSPESSLPRMIMSGPIEAVCGIVIGVLFGIGLAFMFKATKYEKGKFDHLCPLYMLFLAASVIFVGDKLKHGGGPLAVIAGSSSAVMVWKAQLPGCKQEDILQVKSCSKTFDTVWTVFETILFSLMGLDLHLQRIRSTTVALALAMIIVLIVVRILSVFVAVSFSSLCLRERLFVALAWMPKTTVQAALAPIALDIVRKTATCEQDLYERSLEYSETILTVSVLAIMVTAPLGSSLVALAAPKLLRRELNEISETTE